MLRQDNCPIDTIMIHCTTPSPRYKVSRAELDRWHRAEGFEPYVNPKNGEITYAGYHLLEHLDGSYERPLPESADNRPPRRTRRTKGLPQLRRQIRIQGDMNTVSYWRLQHVRHVCHPNSQ